MLPKTLSTIVTPSLSSLCKHPFSIPKLTILKPFNSSRLPSLKPFTIRMSWLNKLGFGVRSATDSPVDSSSWSIVQGLDDDIPALVSSSLNLGQVVSRGSNWATIGDEKFMELGLYDMGDEVACKWTADDEQVFHEIVLSNPVSHGRKFWKHLRDAFPTRTKKELVSYYFNVFMLRRRVVQNRSYMLEIDSDDDEDRRGAHGDSPQNGSHSLDSDTDNDEDHQHVPNGECYLIGRDDEDSTVESFGNQELDASWVDNFWSEPENIPKDDGSNRNHRTPEGNVEKQNDVEIDGRNEEISGQETKKLDDDHIFGS